MTIGRTKWTMQMRRTLIRYKTRPEATQQNRKLIEDVFYELQAKSPDGVRYMVPTVNRHAKRTPFLG